jgi:hypothetical protein
VTSGAGDVIIVRRRDLQTGERARRWSEQDVEQLVHEARHSPSIWQTLLELYDAAQPETPPGAGGAEGDALRQRVGRVVGAAFARGDFVVIKPEPVSMGFPTAAPAAASASRAATPSQLTGGPAEAPAARASSTSARSSSSRRSSSSSSTCVARAGHFYTGASKTVARLVSYECQIVARASVLPCEGTATFDAFCATWTGITKADITKWCQIGFTRRRYSPHTEIKFWTKVEVKAGPAAADYYYASHAAPTIGTTYTYRGDLNPDTGKWEVFVDGAQVDQFTNRGWINLTGDRVDYQGEIYDENSQIAGTSGARCKFSSCRYRTASRRSSSSGRGSSSSSGSGSNWTVGAWTNAALTAGDCTTDDAARWGNNRIDGQTLEIWDKRF